MAKIINLSQTWTHNDESSLQFEHIFLRAATLIPIS